MADETRENLPIKTDKMYRVVEFYSGIGGMHFAAKGCGFKTKVVGALEINTTANSVYRHNFSDVNLLQCNIEGLTSKDLDHLAADIFLMSPPCQPFTRVGLKGASNDPRTKSFLHIMELILRMSKPPEYLLMENVKGFETSDTRDHFVATLDQAGYYYQEFLVSPNQLGIPNSRLRYYMLAKKKPKQFYFETKSQIIDQIPERPDGLQPSQCTCSSFSNNELTKITTRMSDNESSMNSISSTRITNTSLTTNTQSQTNSSSVINAESTITKTLKPNTEICTNCTTCSSDDQVKDMEQSTKCQTQCTYFNNSVQRTLSEFLEDGSEEYFKPFLLSEKVLGRFALVLDIVTPSSTHSCCFTKAYGHYAEGTGSVLKMADIDDTEYFNKYRLLDTSQSDSERAAALSDLKLRYFTPREVANIMCFPSSFGFPNETTTKQQYRLLGNSLNVHVVTELLKCLLTDP